MRPVLNGMIGALFWHVTSMAALTETAVWSRIDMGLQEEAVVAVVIDPVTPTRIFAASPSAVYASTDHGWQQQLRLPTGVTVNRMAWSSGKLSAVFIATTQGLYASFDNGNTWSHVFHGRDQAGSYCTAVVSHPSQPTTVLLGTHDGLWISIDQGHQWALVPIPSLARHVLYLRLDPSDTDRLYLVSQEGLFIGSLTTGEWQQCLTVLHTPEESPQEPSSDDPPAEPDRVTIQLNAIAVHPTRPSTVYLATSRGLQVSTDRGVTWQPLSSAGLLSPRITSLLLQVHSPVALYAATDRGIAQYHFSRAQWELLTNGLTATHIHELAGADHTLWAATDHGLFRYEIPLQSLRDGGPPTAQELLADFPHEPTIRQVQEAAIRYAEVHPKKISAWRTQARLRAFLPKVSVTSSTSSTDFHHWDTGTNPDSLLRGERDLDWNANVSWDLANLIWSDDQTAIDVRSKLMVELRDDIVDEVTRAYFERRRLQVALLTDPPHATQTTLEKELRIQELTALIDGLTGGYFSQCLQPTSHEGGTR